MLQTADLESAQVQGRRQRFYRRLVAQVAVVLRRESGSVGRGEPTFHAKVNVRHEVFDGAFALHDHAHRHRLHTAGAESAAHLLPKYRRQFEAHEAVEHPAGLLGVHQVHVNAARIFNGLEDGGLGNFVKYDALGLRNVEVEGLGQVPRNGLSLAVLIAREPDGFGGLGKLAELCDHVFFVFAHHVFRGETLVDVDAYSALGQVADVPKAGTHGVGAPEVFFDGLRFGGRFDDDEVLGHELRFTPTK